MVFECFQGWRFHDLSGQPIPVLSHSPGKNDTFQLVHTVAWCFSSPSAGLRWTLWGSCLFISLSCQDLSGWQPDPLGHQPLCQFCVISRLRVDSPPSPRLIMKTLSNTVPSTGPWGTLLKPLLCLSSLFSLSSYCCLSPWGKFPNAPSWVTWMDLHILLKAHPPSSTCLQCQRYFFSAVQDIFHICVFPLVCLSSCLAVGILWFKSHSSL